MKHRKVVKHFLGKTKTVSSEAYNHDINAMVAGRVPFTQNRRPAFYIDETVFPETFEDARQLVIDAQDAFMRLPPEIRQKFKNDPALLAVALGDPRRQDELRELGLLPPLSDPPAEQKPPKGASDGRKTAVAGSGGVSPQPPKEDLSDDES